MSCVLTLALDAESQGRLEAERQQNFPPALNRIPAHLTLFHTLPENDEAVAVLTRISAQQLAFSVQVKELRSMGRGVAYFVESPEVKMLHCDLSAAFGDDLSAQDRQGFRPHVVVQNKVDSSTARKTLVLLQAAFAPWIVQAVGLDLWRYLNGPWQHLQRFRFSGE